MFHRRLQYVPSVHCPEALPCRKARQNTKSSRKSCLLRKTAPGGSQELTTSAEKIAGRHPRNSRKNRCPLSAVRWERQKAGKACRRESVGKQLKTLCRRVFRASFPANSVQNHPCNRQRKAKCKQQESSLAAVPILFAPRRRECSTIRHCNGCGSFCSTFDRSLQPAGRNCGIATRRNVLRLLRLFLQRRRRGRNRGNRRNRSGRNGGRSSRFCSGSRNCSRLGSVHRMHGVRLHKIIVCRAKAEITVAGKYQGTVGATVAAVCNPPGLRR